MNAHALVNSLLEVADPDDPVSMLAHLKAVEGCPHCGCPDSERGTAFCTPQGHTVQNLYCKKCGRTYCRGEEHTNIVRENDDPEMARIRKRVAKAQAARLAQQPIPAEDDPEAYVKGEVARRAEPIKKLEVQGNRWFRRGPGGVYCKAYIYINDKLEHVTPEQYGYNDHYLTLAADWLERNGYIQRRHPSEPLWQTAQHMGFEFIRNVTDVRRERDL